MTTRHLFAACGLLTIAVPATAQVDQAVAAQYFTEAETLCTREAGRLWGVSLCGPIVIADPRTGTIATSEPAPSAPRPRALGFANAAMMWGDRRWTTLIWPLPDRGEAFRRRMILHELFHRVQFDLKLIGPDGDGSHLDTLDGRYWQQLEWRALAAAIERDGDDRLGALGDALAFRRARLAAFPGSDEQERRLLINEGLAQYTGTVAATGGGAAAEADARQQLQDAPDAPTFVRTFPYPSGAAYGVLLDAFDPGWARRVRVSDDLVAMLVEAAPATASADVSAAAARYDGATLRAAEVTRDEQRQARVAALTRRYVTGPVVVLPAGRNAAFVTTGLTALPGAGVVYQQYRVTGDWGSLVAAEILVATDRQTLTLAAPFTTDGATLRGDGWTITLNDGWRAVPMAEGRWRVTK